MLIVVALGGNAITLSKEKVTYDNLSKNIKKSCENIVKILKRKNSELVVVFGSGPQIGALILQNEIAKQNVAPMPLDVLDAEIQGEIGYIIDQSFINLLSKYKIMKPVVSIVTQVLVDKDDPAFLNPTKPVGPFYTKKEALGMKNNGMILREEKGKGWRRVVPSPKPLYVIESDIVKKLSHESIVIAAGGGGIPIIKKGGNYHGIDAVIDKDLASACLAKSINADILLILTDISHASLNFKTRKEQKIKTIKVAKLKKYLNEGQFPPGSMGPKIEACIEFIENGGKKAIITNPQNARNALMGKTGTVVVK